MHSNEEVWEGRRALPGNREPREEGGSAPRVSAGNRTSCPRRAPLPRPGPRSHGASPGTSVPELRAALVTGSAPARGGAGSQRVSPHLPLPSGAHALLWLLENRGGGGV